MIILIWLYVSFMLVNSTIRYIFDIQYLNITCIILHFVIFPFFKHYFHYNIYAILLIILHRTAGPSRCLFFDIYNKFVVLTNNKPQLFTVVIWLHCILRQQYGQNCVFVIYIHKGKCNSLIFILLLFCLLHRKNIQDKTRWLFFLIVLHLVKSVILVSF